MSSDETLQSGYTNMGMLLQPPHAAELLLDRILSTALDWFRQPTGWFTHGSPWQAE